MSRSLRRPAALLVVLIALLFARPAAAADPLQDPGSALRLLPSQDPPPGERAPRPRLSLESRDGRSALTIHARIQPRLVIERAGDGPATSSMQIRRARLKLSGHLLGVHRRFYIQLGFSPRDLHGGIEPVDGEPAPAPLRDARVEFGRFRDANLRIGLMKVPFSRERLVSGAKLGMIDRSIVDSEFHLDRDIGVVLRSDDLGGLGSRIGYAAGIFAGEGRNAFELSKPAYLYVARLELRPLGPLDGSDGADLARSDSRLQIGLAYAFHDDAQAERGTHGERPDDLGTTDLHLATLDAVYRWRGIAFEAALVWRHGRRPQTPGPTSGYQRPRNGLGWFAQLGVLLPRTSVELVGRFASVRALDSARSSLTSNDELGLGINWYIGDHDLKVQVDYAHALDLPMAAATSRDTVRLQLQVAI